MKLICNWQQLRQQVSDIREKNVTEKITEKIVFTNGCFDLLHVGHVKYLQKARSLGSYLIVAVNSDSSVKRLKGDSRPLQTDGDRIEIVDALRCVSFATLFEQDTPYDLIKWIEPDILVKGGDWKPEQIVGNDIVRARGGEVHSLPFVQGRSTTQLIEKMQ